MQPSVKKLSFVFGALALLSFVDVAPADAALLDWLFPGRRTTRQYYVLPAGTAASPYVANYGVGYSGITPTTSAYTTNYWGNSQPYSWYAPQAQYRTMWTPTPVTSYSPVAANGMIPSVGYAWQANRVPVIAYQPTLPTVPATPVPNVLPPASIAPSLAAPAQAGQTWGQPSCSCDVTANYGASSAWTADAAGVNSADWTTVDPGTLGSTTAGYMPSSETVNASPWTAIEPAAASSSNDSYTTNFSPALTGDSTISGATPWMTAEEFRRAAKGASSSTESGNQHSGTELQQSDDTPWLPKDDSATSPADLTPSISNKLPVAPQLDNGHENPWQVYEDESKPGGPAPSGPATANYQSVPRQSNKQLIPSFIRPIPDPDRAGSAWDFDDKLQLQPREPRSARAGSRWQAIPINHLKPTSSDRIPDRVLDPPTRPDTVRDEGGWRSAPR